jgi:hypothetical protein
MNVVEDNLNALKINIENRYTMRIDAIVKSPNRDDLIRGILMDRKVFVEINTMMEKIILDETKTDAEKIIQLKGLCFGFLNE